MPRPTISVMKIILFAVSGRQKSIVIAGKGKPPAPDLNCLSHINFSVTLLISLARSYNEIRKSCLPNASSHIPATQLIDVSHENANLEIFAA